MKCQACGGELSGRTWHARLFPHIPPTAWTSLDPAATITEQDITTCSEACMRLIESWVMLRRERETGRRRS